MRARPESGEGGWIEQDGIPDEVYRYPANPYVARFLGFHNLIAGAVAEVMRARSAGGYCERRRGTGEHENRRSTECPRFTHLVTRSVRVPLARSGRTPLGTLIAAVHPRGPHASSILVRPEAAAVRPAGTTGPNIVPGRLVEASFRGSYYLIRTEHAGGIMLACEVSVTTGGLPAAGQPLASMAGSRRPSRSCRTRRIRTSVLFILTKTRFSGIISTTARRGPVRTSGRFEPSQKGENQCTNVSSSWETWARTLRCVTPPAEFLSPASA